MIDCSKTVNFIKEKCRMTNNCQICCTKCPLSQDNNGADNMTCFDFEEQYPKKTIEVVQQWSDTHPQKTYLTDLLEKYPNIPLDNNGKPSYVCPHDLGLMSAENCKLGLMSVEDCKKDSNKCVECWNQIAEEG